MRAPEAQELLEDIEDWFMKHGLPINIRDGSNEEVTKHMIKVIKPFVHIDEPLGVIQGNDYDHCPICNGIVGQSAYYCKLCGAKIREGGR